MLVEYIFVRQFPRNTSLRKNILQIIRGGWCKILIIYTEFKLPTETGSRVISEWKEFLYQGEGTISSPRNLCS